MSKQKREVMSLDNKFSSKHDAQCFIEEWKNQKKIKNCYNLILKNVYDYFPKRINIRF